MAPQSNFEHVLATCQATGAKMILPLIASQVHKIVTIDNLTLALLYTAMRQLHVYQAKAAEIQIPGTLQVPNSWWVDAGSECTAAYTTWPLRDIISEAEVFFAPVLVCSIFCIEFAANHLARPPPTRYPCYLTLGVHPKTACWMHDTFATIFCGHQTMTSSTIWGWWDTVPEGWRRLR